MRMVALVGYTYAPLTLWGKNDYDEELRVTNI